MTLEQAIEVLISRYNSGVIRSRTNDDEWRLATDTVIAALRDMLKRREGCWHCHGIEAHEIEYVTELKNAYLEHIKAPEAIPYRHCANCGRELSGNAEQVKEGEDETKSEEGKE